MFLKDQPAPAEWFSGGRNNEVLETFQHWILRQSGRPLPESEENPAVRALARATFNEVLEFMSFGTRSLNSSDLANLLSAGFEALVERSYSANTALVDPIVRDVVVKNFQDTALGEITIAEPGVSDYYPSDAEIRPAEVSVATATGRVVTRHLALRFSKFIVANAELPLMTNIVAAAAAKMGELPARDLCALLNSNTGPDGAALIDDDNTVRNAFGLDTAISKLARLYRVLPAFWVVPPERAATAAEALQQRPALNITLVILPWLDSSDYSYLVPDPTIRPVFARLGFVSPPVPQIARKRPDPQSVFLGQEFIVTLDSGMATMSRAIVRLQSE